MRKRTPIQKAAHAGRLIAAALVAAACIRFAAVAVATAMEEDQKPPTASAPQPSGSSGRERLPGSAGAPPSQATTPPAPPGEPIRVQLLVNVGTERSEVFVDGAKIGSSPFLGTITCKSGAKLDIEVVITKGVVYGYERTCAPGTIRVDAAP